MNYELDDTIAAIATAPGDGGLCVVRISGKTSLEVADRIFRGKDRPSRCKTHTIHYGRVVEPDTEA
ncbi:MAG: tRNA uridine-5-carboxymethylaminomethyl(34) synthesis GTPase MnmE, partial [candidate division Zixibacteria bacterium]|nr:tRNA uridine-5-carboxymethylaminomethyl(34) synthesis GTPase MnmE [candidate division Zixibacteria bacterium]